MEKYLSTITIFIFAVYVIGLYQVQQLDFYIHPRYIAFTYVMALIALGFTVAAFIHFLESKTKFNWNTRVVSGFIILAIPLLLGFGLPEKPLSTVTAEQRIVDFNSLRSGEINTAQLFLGSTTSYGIGDWVNAINFNPDLEFYEGKAVDVSGFKFDNFDSDQLFSLSRFIITCCAVDARPVGLPVAVENKQEYADNQWYRVQGEFGVQEVNGRQQLVIIPEQIEEIEVPDDPYVY